ncbi:MAG: hypothetical protein SF182_30635, partial [Deltaproteobacteria bacterium]|nr:hypothetical protein [Deltaproteobacteria bacterium]
MKSAGIAAIAVALVVALVAWQRRSDWSPAPGGDGLAVRSAGDAAAAGGAASRGAAANGAAPAP